MTSTSRQTTENGRSNPIVGLENISAFIADIPTPEIPSDFDGAQESSLKKTWDDQKHDLLSARYSGDTFVRKCLAHSTQGIIAAWLACIIIILMCNKSCFHLSDTVLITLLGTTTATVLGLALIVLNGFFKHMNQNVDLHDRHNQ